MPLDSVYNEAHRTALVGSQSDLVPGTNPIEAVEDTRLAVPIDVSNHYRRAVLSGGWPPGVPANLMGTCRHSKGAVRLQSDRHDLCPHLEHGDGEGPLGVLRPPVVRR